MNSLPKIAVASEADFRRFAADRSNEAKTVVDAAAMQVRGEIPTRQQIEGLVAHSQNHDLEFSFPVADKNSASIVKAFIFALQEKYGEEVTDWAFPQDLREHAVEHGLDPKTMKIVFEKIDCDRVIYFRDRTKAAAHKAAIAQDPSESKKFAADAKYFSQQTKAAAVQFIQSVKESHAPWDVDVLKADVDQLTKEAARDASQAAQNADRSYRLISGLDLATDHATKKFEQAPLSEAEAKIIIAQQNKKQEGIALPETKDADVMSSEIDDARNAQSKAAPRVDKNKFGDIPTDVAEKSELLRDNTKIFNDWQFLKIDIKKAEHESSWDWVKREFNKEYDVRNLSQYHREKFIKPFEARRQEAEQRWNILKTQLAELEIAHPFLKAEQAQRKETQQRVHEHLADANGM